MVNGLSDCLQEANLAQYTNNFIQLGVGSLDALSNLTIQEYSQFGITDLADKKRLFRLIHIVKRVKADKRKSPEQQAGKGSGQRKQQQSLEDDEKQSRSQNSPPNHPSPLSRPSNVQEKSPTLKSGTSIGTKDDSSGPRSNSLPKKSDSLLSVARKELKKGALSPGTLRKLETTGGILFVKSTSASPRTSPRSRSNPNARKKLLLRESLSDSDITDSDFTDSYTINRTNFGAPNVLKKSFIEVIDHRDSTVYNYGIPSHELQDNVIHHRSPGTPQARTSDEIERIKVCVRKRPLNKKEERDNEVDVVQTEGQGTVVMNEAKVAVDLTKFLQVHKYHFDEVFGERCSNEEVYARTAKPLISTMFNRGKATCFAYGQTGAGKTHTMLGNDTVRGLYLLAAEDIFAALQSSKRAGNELGVWASYFEIYCGQLFDLLNDRQRVYAREDSQHRVCIAGIKEVQVTGPQTLMQVVEQGNRLRVKGASGVNIDSSRSHAILQLQLQDGGRHKLGRFSFIDLAGSERACDTVDPDKVTRYEGAEINTSLLALKECIRALDQEQRHTPFRQSKLTQVLRDSFLGQSKTCMIANIAPNSTAVEHTLNTLRYADRVKELKKETSSKSPASPYPSTPNTFSPGTTSTPLKMSNNKQMQTPKTQMSTPSNRSKGNTPGSVPSHQNPVAGRRITPTRKVSSEKASAKPSSQQREPRRKLDESREEESNSRRNVSQEVVKKDVNNCETPDAKSMPKIGDGKIQCQDSNRKSSSAKKGLNVTFDSLKGNNETPSKRSKEVRAQTKEAFLHNNTLPVWFPPEEEEPFKATPKTVGKVWEIDNPRYAHKPQMPAAPVRVSSPPLRETLEKGLPIDLPTKSKTLDANPGHELQEGHVSNSEQYSTDQELRFSADDEMTDTWSRRNDSSIVKYSLQARRSETSCSTDTNSTIELLAEIDHALRNSLVSPVSESGLSDNLDSDKHPAFRASQSEVNAARSNSKRHRTQSEPHPKSFPECRDMPSATDNHGILKQDFTLNKQVTASHAMSLHPEIRINRSPDSMSTDSLQDLEAERILSHQTWRQNPSAQHTTTQKDSQVRTPSKKADHSLVQNGSSSLRSKLTVQGIESLPSPRDIKRVAPQAAVQPTSEVKSRDQTINIPPTRRSEQYEKNIENPSGVIVSTSFHEYVASAEPHQGTPSEPPKDHVTRVDPIRPAPIGQNHSGSIVNTTPFKRGNRGLSSSNGTVVLSPVTVEVLRTENRSSAFSPISSPSSSLSTKPTPNKAFMKESLSSSVIQDQTQLETIPRPTPIAKERVIPQHQWDNKQQIVPPMLVKQHLSVNQGGSSCPEKVTGSSINTEVLVPKLQLDNTMTGGSEDVRKSLLTPRQNSAIEKAKELLVSAHAEQIDELERLCEKEWRLIKQLHTGEKGLSEYLRYAKDLMTSKLRCIDTFQDQLSTFSRCSTPDVSPRSRSPMEAW